MVDTNADPLKYIDRLTKSLARRVAFWPPAGEYETEVLELDFAGLLTEKYVEILGLARVADIIRASVTEPDMLESLQEELGLKEKEELANPVEDGDHSVDQRNTEGFSDLINGVKQGAS